MRALSRGGGVDFGKGIYCGLGFVREGREEGRDVLVGILGEESLKTGEVGGGEGKRRKNREEGEESIFFIIYLFFSLIVLKDEGGEKEEMVIIK